jgi:hypothetical protein
MREDAKKRAGLALATALSLACVAALLGVASWGRGGARPVAMAYQHMSMQGSRPCQVAMPFEGLGVAAARMLQPGLLSLLRERLPCLSK